VTDILITCLVGRGTVFSAICTGRYGHHSNNLSATTGTADGSQLTSVDLMICTNGASWNVNSTTVTRCQLFPPARQDASRFRADTSLCRERCHAHRYQQYVTLDTKQYADIFHAEKEAAGSRWSAPSSAREAFYRTND